MSGSGPLAGIRIVEFDAIGPVPLAGMILAGLGADIVRISRPGTGAWSEVGGVVLHRGRATVTLDLRDATQREQALVLIDRADAVIEGSRPGVMERLGLGPDDVLPRNPSLVFARVTGWGQEGPLATTAGHDINYIALTGVLHAIGSAGEPPTVPLNLIGDYAAGSMFACLGLVSAILSARRTGQGQVVDVAMVDGVVTMMSLVHALGAAGLWRDERGTNLLDGSAPFYRCYVCADGKSVAVGALEPQFFVRLLEGLSIDVPYGQYDSSEWPAMTALFEERFAERTRDEWADLFAGTDACVTPVLSIAESLSHPANVDRSVFIDADGVRQAAPAPRFSLGVAPVSSPSESSVDDVLARWI